MRLYAGWSAVSHSNYASYAAYDGTYHTTLCCSKCGTRSNLGYHYPANPNDPSYANRYDYYSDGSHCAANIPPYTGHTYFYSCAACGSGFTCYHINYAYDPGDGFAYCSRCGMRLSFNPYGQW